MAAEVEALYLTASVDDPAAVKAWLDDVDRERNEVEAAFDRLARVLAARPHIALTVRHVPGPTASAAAEGEGAGTPGGAG
jgi:hypothetical protein